MNGRNVSRLTAACALAAALHLAAPPLAAAGPPGRAGLARHGSWIESVGSWLAGRWQGLTAIWANEGGGLDPLG
ncbi:MAG TPA: hypothetical protein VF121_12245 [Thermoanaerobaculia bacterium]|nr:hypothetical protein [Thermoanaerobaculia bacterium]